MTLRGWTGTRFGSLSRPWLNEEPKIKQETPDLPGFSLALDAINAMEPEAICTRVSDQEAAMSALRAGMGLLGASIEYHKREKKDILLLQNLKASLLDRSQGAGGDNFRLLRATVIISFNIVACNSRNKKKRKRKNGRFWLFHEFENHSGRGTGK